VVLKARHLCMESRGVCQQGHHTVTSALRGAFKDEGATRSEFLRLAI
jgi:GTP cyclohydrolase I